jgi:ATP-dependent RNA helicase RhlE
MTRNTKRASNKADDPLFTQPYISKYADVNALIDESSELNKKPNHRQLPKRQVPALFISPATNKQKKSEAS